MLFCGHWRKLNPAFNSTLSLKHKSYSSCFFWKLCCLFNKVWIVKKIRFCPALVYISQLIYIPEQSHTSASKLTQEKRNGVYLKFKAFLKHKYLVQWVTDFIFRALITKSIYLNIKKIIIRKTFYLFCFFSMTFLEGLAFGSLILFFTSLLWQLSCKAWYSKKKSVWVVEMYYFLGLRRLEMSGDLLPSHLSWFYWWWVTQLFDERWIGKKRNVMIWFGVQWRGDALDSLVYTWVPIFCTRTRMSNWSPTRFLSLLRQESSVLFSVIFTIIYC